MGKYLKTFQILPAKGQIISKGLFGVLEFSQETNKRIHRSSKNELVCFLGEFQDTKSLFEII